MNYFYIITFYLFITVSIFTRYKIDIYKKEQEELNPSSKYHFKWFVATKEGLLTLISLCLFLLASSLYMFLDGPKNSSPYTVDNNVISIVYITVQMLSFMVSLIMSTFQFRYYLKSKENNSSFYKYYLTLPGIITICLLLSYTILTVYMLLNI